MRFLDELWEDPGVLANGYIANYEHTLLGQLRGEAPPVQMLGTPTAVQRASPALGEHTDEVLAELGFSAEGDRRLPQRRRAAVSAITPG